MKTASWAASLNRQTAAMPMVLALLLTLAPPPGRGATVVAISDGDTLRLRQRRDGALITVRLACIDAPERRQIPQGTEARRRLQALLPLGSLVQLRVQATDRYGRSVAELSRGGTNVNQALVASGAAFVYWRYIRGCDRQTYGRLETEARLRRLGVWAVAGGITRPWEWRAARRQLQSSAQIPRSNAS